VKELVLLEMKEGGFGFFESSPFSLIHLFSSRDREAREPEKEQRNRVSNNSIMLGLY
jgi:hypothetical protein